MANTPSSSSSSSSSSFYPQLVSWIQSHHGGYIHPSLSLKPPTSTTPRGIQTQTPISKNELLIRLPACIVVSGEGVVVSTDHHHLPKQQDAEPPQQQPSPWLRCLIKLVSIKYHHDKPSPPPTQQQQQCNNHSTDSFQDYYSPYIRSLPTSFETLHTWTISEISEYLSGTTLGEMAHSDRIHNTSRTFFDTRIRPVLYRHNGLDEIGWEEFLWCSQCISTRGFHLGDDSQQQTNDNDDDDGDYSGPFLLPYIDLLNHCPNQSKCCTTLRRDPMDHSFIMMAERDIKKGEEIRHGYGDASLTSAQLLQTFGFVPMEAMEAVVATRADGNSAMAMTPAVLSRDELVEACREVSTSSDVQELRQSRVSGGAAPEEVWDPRHAWEEKRRFLTSVELIPHDILLSSTTEKEDDDDAIHQIVTCCTIVLLPDEASLQELFDDGLTLLTDKVLFMDEYLGLLICKSVLCAIVNKRKRYGGSSGDDWRNDGKVLMATWLETYCGEVELKRKMEGWTIRMEELWCLDRLEKKVVGWLQRLEERGSEENDDGDDVGEERSCATDSRRTEGSKRVKLV